MVTRPGGKILGASLGHCVHVAGILNFLKLAERFGYITISLGPAVPVGKLAEEIKQRDPDIVAVSYRLTPEVLKGLLGELQNEIEKGGWQDKTFVFGGTPPAAEIARRSGLFEAVFSGLEPLSEIQAFLEGRGEERNSDPIPPQTLRDRIAFQTPSSQRMRRI